MANIDFVTNGTKTIINVLDELGCDFEALLMITADIFKLCDSLGFNDREATEFVMRLKVVNNFRMK